MTQMRFDVKLRTCMFLIFYLNSVVSTFLRVGFYHKPQQEGYLEFCNDDNFDENDTCNLTEVIDYRSVRLLKGSCVELHYLDESIFMTEFNKDLSHSFHGGYAKKCESYNTSLICPDGQFVKEIEWDTEFELTRGFKLSCYEPKFYQSDATILESHPGAKLFQSDKRKCASTLGITLKIDDEKDSVVGFDLKNNCTVGYSQGIRSSCLTETALSGIHLVIENQTNYIKSSSLICTEIPNIASLCIPEDEKQILLTYIGNTTNTKVTLKLEKRFGVGKSLVMSYLNMNEFEFYTSSGFKFQSSIPALSKNFKNSDKTDFDWSSAADNIWQEERRVKIDIDTKAGCTTEIIEIVGKCSFIDVRLAQYTRVDTCHGERSETVVVIPDSILNLTFRKEIFELFDSDKIQNQKKGIVRNNAVEVFVKHTPYIIEKFIRQFKL